MSRAPAEGTLRLKLPTGWRSSPESAPFSMARDGEDHTITFSVLPDNVKPGEFKITADAEYAGKHYEEGYRLAGYAGLRPYPSYKPAVYRAVGVDVKRLRPAYASGTFPAPATTFRKRSRIWSRNVRILAASDIMQGNLSGYDAIILGTRGLCGASGAQVVEQPAARVREERAGVLIVQYNLQDFDQNYGPYPFSLGNNPQKSGGRVFEGSPAEAREPGDGRGPIESRKRISPAGWKSAGHGFMQTWDSHYEATGRDQ